GAAASFVDDFDIGEPLELQSRRDDAEGLVEQEDPLLPSEEAAEATPMASAWETRGEPDEAETEPADLSELDTEELEDRILDDPDSGALHRALGDRLAREGDLGRAVEEFVLSITAFERDDAWLPALDAVDALLALEPDAIRHQQKRVELAYRSGDRARLLGAYMGLAEALVRAEALDKAVAVYRRVLEHDPGNASAQDALAWLEQETAPLVEEVPPAAEQRPAPSEPVATEAPPAAAAPAPARPASRPASADSADYVDLGSMVIDAGGPRDTRMRVDGERPTGDEQKDFQETLEQFKKGIEANLGTEDYEAHYDLGIAFKEMGLLDEAIAEFQKALRSPSGRLRTSEALGITFFEKQQFAIAETILRRAVETLEGGDDEKIGLLYWLGRACESQGKSGDARQAFERALAVDIRFMDLNDRIRQLAAGRSS
ncbi:MAG TPA: tetratricopeptide repeat protein, partial [Gemmatimonadales bacterium]|nr:tetratricopeptide repeat protein [Gemmatimonadales bacterium]